MSSPTLKFRSKVYELVGKFNNMEVTIITCLNKPIYYIKSNVDNSIHTRLLRFEVITNDSVDGYEFYRQLVEIINNEPQEYYYKVTSLNVREFNLGTRTIKFSKSD